MRSIPLLTNTKGKQMQRARSIADKLYKAEQLRSSVLDEAIRKVARDTETIALHSSGKRQEALQTIQHQLMSLVGE